jgi:tetratricopeptide (TPR) repeat protein
LQKGSWPSLFGEETVLVLRRPSVVPVVAWFFTRLSRFVNCHPVRATVAALLIAVGLAAFAAHLWAAWHFAEGDRLVRRQAFAEAYPHYLNCLKIWRWSAETQLVAGRTARRASMVAEASQHFERCLSLSSRDSAYSAAVALERLLIMAQGGDLLDIEAVLWDKVKRDGPETLLILEALARGYIRGWQLGPAMKCLNMILERDRDNADALFNRGWCSEHTDLFPEAIRDYRRALHLHPERDDFRLRLAQTLLRLDANEAIGHFEQLMERQPDNPDVVLGLAHAYQAAGLADGSEKAMALVEELLQKEPENASALTEIGALLVRNGNITEGEAFLRHASANDPYNFDAHYQLFVCLRQQRNREAEADAERQISERIRSDRLRLAHIATREMSKTPFDPNLHYELGMIWYRNGKFEPARRWFLSALKLDPTHQPTRAALEHFRRIGDTANSEKHRAESNGKAQNNSK